MRWRFGHVLCTFPNHCDTLFVLSQLERSKGSQHLSKGKQTSSPESNRNIHAKILHGRLHLPPIWPLGSGGTQHINRLKPMIMQPMIQKLSE